MKSIIAALFVAILSLAGPSGADASDRVLIAQAKAEVIDINRAKADQLMTL